MVIDFPAFALDDSRCAKVLGKALKMKLEGYMATYSDKVMPMDKADFFGTHIMLCEENAEGELDPILAYKATPLDRCYKFHYEFPVFTILGNDMHPSVGERVYEIVQEAGDPSKVSFDSSWAQNLNYRFNHDKEMKEELREITMMLAVKHHQHHKIPYMMVSAASLVKTDVFFSRLGLSMINEHARFKEKKLDHSEGILFYSTTFSLEAHRMAKKYESLWENRIFIDGLALQKEALETQKNQKKTA